MSSWTHNLCRPCWNALYGSREPSVVTNASLDICCACGNVNSVGIYIRYNPRSMQCGGNHKENESCLK
jgi:hypothetical protein